MELSYWEYKTWLSNVDFTIIGSGIVGLNCALQLKEKYPAAKVLVLEKGMLPQGASTKNAGFACFGSISEVLSDLRTHTKEDVADLVKKRWEGIQLSRKLLGDESIGFQQNGGHELFLKSSLNLFESCLGGMEAINKLLKPIFGEAPFIKKDNVFSFGNVENQYITHKFEGQLDTGKLMDALLQKVLKKGVHILNSVEVKHFEDVGNSVSVATDFFSFETKKLLVATNGFAAKLLKKETILPARAQVLVTKPIKNLKIKGTFHLDEGYYYFRNIDNRILLGGGRNLDFKAEETTAFGQTELIQNKLEQLLQKVILPHQEVEIDQRWSGIMGVGKQKTPIVERVSNNVMCGVRLGGMGVALGSLIGKELASLID
ncbi:NAD(P)/FAD-dependent oxidoreductase [Flagellimonas pacifica]|uniref:Glycine/D-amino acid oxidase n=1 Tax=Flagellimonas pacifica TaxID=1247520 RepID=A0A285MEP4_9FLAO|nr:FAD-dependent oxidoreductase [Allomuricauda parva]SNY94927.1 Glycine/D-amino acid oxidase [Allomuricauda parva]